MFWWFRNVWKVQASKAKGPEQKDFQIQKDQERGIFSKDKNGILTGFMSRIPKEPFEILQQVPDEKSNKFALDYTFFKTSNWREIFSAFRFWNLKILLEHSGFRMLLGIADMRFVENKTRLYFFRFIDEKIENHLRALRDHRVGLGNATNRKYHHTQPGTAFSGRKSIR